MASSVNVTRPQNCTAVSRNSTFSNLKRDFMYIFSDVKFWIEDFDNILELVLLGSC